MSEDLYLPFSTGNNSNSTTWLFDLDPTMMSSDVQALLQTWALPHASEFQATAFQPQQQQQQAALAQLQQQQQQQQQQPQRHHHLESVAAINSTFLAHPGERHAMQMLGSQGRVDLNLPCDLDTLQGLADDDNMENIQQPQQQPQQPQPQEWQADILGFDYIINVVGLQSCPAPLPPQQQPQQEEDEEEEENEQDDEDEQQQEEEEEEDEDEVVEEVVIDEGLQPYQLPADPTFLYRPRTHADDSNNNNGTKKSTGFAKRRSSSRSQTASATSVSASASASCRSLTGQLARRVQASQGELKRKQRIKHEGKSQARERAPRSDGTKNQPREKKPFISDEQASVLLTEMLNDTPDCAIAVYTNSKEKFLPFGQAFVDFGACSTKVEDLEWDLWDEFLERIKAGNLLTLLRKIAIPEHLLRFGEEAVHHGVVYQRKKVIKRINKRNQRKRAKDAESA